MTIPVPRGIRLSAATNDPVVPPSEPLRLMAVHAHPDDESSKGAATMARYVREGAEVMVATLTGGERGDILNKAMERPDVRENLPSIRREEMARAREILGVHQQFLGFVDSGLPEGDPLPPLPDGCFALQPLDVAAAPLVRAVREFRPHVILTYDEEGGYPHPDHIKTHEVAVEASRRPPTRTATRGPGTRGSRSSCTTSPRSTRTASPRCMRRCCGGAWSRPTPSGQALGEAGEAGRKPVDITSRVQCADYFPIRDQALLAHATQIDPESSWFACPVEVQRTAWPTEDYRLARSVVDTEFPEDDLFAGLRERVTQ